MKKRIQALLLVVASVVLQAEVPQETERQMTRVEQGMAKGLGISAAGTLIRRGELSNIAVGAAELQQKCVSMLQGMSKDENTRADLALSELAIGECIDTATKAMSK